jgi:hypothetical protein
MRITAAKNGLTSKLSDAAVTPPAKRLSFRRAREPEDSYAERERQTRSSSPTSMSAETSIPPVCLHCADRAQLLCT